MITNIETINAIGDVLTPIIIYKGKSYTIGLHQGVQSQEDTEVHFTWSLKGWTDHELGFDYLQKHFYLLASQISNLKYPILFLLDGYTSYFSWGFLSFCGEKNVFLLYSPSYSTHVLQPLDVGLFGPLQHAYS